MSTLNVYSYYTAAGFRTYADYDDVVFTGTWSSTGSYYVSAMQVVDYGQSQYICITDSVNRNPTIQPTKWAPTRYWSSFVLVIAGGGTAGQDAAYQIAVAGSNIAVAAYDLALEANGNAGIALAEADAALALAQSGTTLGYAALNAAAAAQDTANGAYSIAITGTSTANYALAVALEALNIAVEGTVIGSAAFDVATVALSTANNALSTASTALSTANSAFSIANAGTSAAGAAQSTANAAYALAVNGTNATIALTGSETGSRIAADAYLQSEIDALSLTTGSISVSLGGLAATADAAYAVATTGTAAAGAAQSTADAAYALAQVGTEIPPLYTLPDVNIPAPTAQQVLMFDGSRWVAADAPSTTATGAFTYYLDETPSGTLGYQTLLPYPSAGTEETDPIFITAGSGLTESTGFLSGILNRTRIDAGLWEFNIYGTVDNNSATLFVAIVLVNLNGTHTELFRTALPDFISSEPVLGITVSTQGSYTILPTDKLLAQFYGTTTSETPVVLALYHNGSEHYSHIHTPLVTSHNDLSGLQGGSSSTNQFYHVTLDQNNALTGTSGTPSASNPFATLESLATEQGTRSAKDQDLQNQTSAAQIRADSAYLLAQIGTNVGTNAYTLAASGSNVAWSAYTLAASTPNYAAGGTMTGNLSVPNVLVGSGTVPVSQAVSGTLYYDLSGPAFQTTTATSGFQVSATNLTNGAEICVVILSDGVSRAITYDSSTTFSWFGTQYPLTSSTNGKKIIVSLSCIKDASAGTYVLGASSPQL